MLNETKDNNQRRKNYAICDLDKVTPGWANGISTQLFEKGELTDADKAEIIKEAATHFGRFLTALGVDWRNDPNSSHTPERVAKAYVNDLWEGRYNPSPLISSFPSDNYREGVVIERGIDIVSMCSHHHQTILGVCHVGYISEDRVIGLSKLNRLVEYFSRRGAIQEELTASVHNAVDKVCEGNTGVIVTVVAKHNCVACRGVKHMHSSMVTTKASGKFLTENAARFEFFQSLRLSTE